MSEFKPMPNKHIELVKKWLADPKSVSQEELEANWDEAFVAYDAAYDAHAARSDYTAARANYTANAARTAARDRSANAAYWVNKYEELTNGE